MTTGSSHTTGFLGLMRCYQFGSGDGAHPNSIDAFFTRQLWTIVNAK